jgi:putative flippase GtrA
MKALFNRTRRFLMFSTVGIFVAGFSYVMLFMLISVAHLEPGWAYVLQAVASIELSFWLNHRYTWANRPNGALWRKLLMFNLTRGLTIPPSQWLFLALVGLNCHYLVANTMTIIISTVINFVICQYGIFRETPALRVKEVEHA